MASACASGAAQQVVQTPTASASSGPSSGSAPAGASASAASAPRPAAPPAPLRALLIGGGPEKTSNQVAIESNVRYLGRPRSDAVFARAQVVRLGSQLIVIECKVVDGDDHVIASADFSMMRVSLRRPLAPGVEGLFRFRLSLLFHFRDRTAASGAAFRLSISRALARTDAETSEPAIIRESSSSRSRGDRRSTAVTVRSPFTDFSMR